MAAHRIETGKPWPWRLTPGCPGTGLAPAAQSALYADFYSEFENNYPVTTLNQPRQKWVP